MPAAALPAPLLTPAHLAMVARGVSVIVASRNAALRPSLMRALGCEVAGDRRQLTVFLARRQSRQLLQDLAATGAIAVVLCEPISALAVQVKGQGVDLRAATEADLPVLRRYVAAMENAIGQVGYHATFARAMLAAPLDDVVAASFTPLEAFDQTPGPQAGRGLGPAGAAA